MDWHTRYIVSWELSMSLDSTFCTMALRNALGTTKPTIFNTDQGVQYTCNEYTNMLSDNNI